MAVPFSNTKQRLPPGFRNLLEAFAREAIRKQPENVVEFGAQFFEAMLAERDRTGYDVAKIGATLEDRFYNIPFERTEVEEPEKFEAARKIQTEYRRYHAVKKVDAMREDIATARVQASVMGYVERHTNREQPSVESPVGDETELSGALPDDSIPAGLQFDGDIDILNSAAVKIQATYKGYRTRKHLRQQQSEFLREPAEAEPLENEESGYSAQQQPLGDSDEAVRDAESEENIDEAGNDELDARLDQLDQLDQEEQQEQQDDSFEQQVGEFQPDEEASGEVTQLDAEQLQDAEMLEQDDSANLPPDNGADADLDQNDEFEKLQFQADHREAEVAETYVEPAADNDGLGEVSENDALAADGDNDNDNFAVDPADEGALTQRSEQQFEGAPLDEPQTNDIQDAEAEAEQNELFDGEAEDQQPEES